MNGKVQFVQRGSDTLLLRGKDVMDFLQRLSTNDLSSCMPGEYRQTIFVDEKAKVIDVASVVPLGESVFLLLNKGNESMMRVWLEKFIFLEHVEIEHRSIPCALFSFLGEGSLSLLSSILNIPLNFSNEYRVYSCEHEQVQIMISKEQFGAFVMINVYSLSDLAPLRHQLLSTHRVEELSSQDFETLRIEQGVGAFGKELTREVNPLEAGMEHLVSAVKGCYIGQEVIARLQTYNKVQKHLTGFLLDMEPNKNTTFGRFFFEDHEVGWTTSHCWSATLHKQIALGYLKSREAYGQLTFSDKDSSITCNAEIASLPFVGMKSV